MGERDCSFGIEACPLFSVRTLLLQPRYEIIAFHKSQHRTPHNRSGEKEGTHVHEKNEDYSLN